MVGLLARTEVQNKRDATSKIPRPALLFRPTRKNKAKNGGLEAGKMACARAFVRVRACASPMCASSYFIVLFVVSRSIFVVVCLRYSTVPVPYRYQYTVHCTGTVPVLYRCT